MNESRGDPGGGVTAGRSTSTDAYGRPMRRLGFSILIAAALLIGSLLVCPLTGQVGWFSPAKIIDGSLPQHELDIYWLHRVPRVLLAALVGAALSAGGVVFQALLRNALASPFTLGVSAGASLGAVLVQRIGPVLGIVGVGALGVTALSAGGLAGALAAIGIVYLLSRSGQRLPTSTLLLAGVILNFFFSSIVLFIQFTADPTGSLQILHWLMGSLEVTGYRPLLWVAPILFTGWMLLLFQTPHLNLLTMGEQSAASRGVDVGRVQKIAFLGASVLTGAAVSVSGPIGFVGLIVPHGARRIFGADHRVLLPAATLLGAAFLVVCDTIARSALPSGPLPVGIVTSLLGGPFFLVLLRGHRRGMVV